MVAKLVGIHVACLQAAEEHRSKGLEAQAELEEELKALREELHSKGHALEELQSQLKALQQVNATGRGISGQVSILVGCSCLQAAVVQTFQWCR